MALTATQDAMDVVLLLRYVCGVPRQGLQGPLPVTRQEAVAAALRLNQLARKKDQGEIDPARIEQDLVWIT